MDHSELSPRGNDPLLVKKVASAIYQVQIDAARKQVESTEFNLAEMKRVMEIAASESDRAAAILLFSYAEDMMLEGIKRNVNHDFKGGFDSLVSPNGLLATAHDRVTFLAALRWIQKSTYSSLTLLRGIRNRFAHNVSCDSFSDVSVAGMVTSMPDFERPLIQQTELRFHNHRQKFLVRAILSVYRLIYDISILPHAIANQVEPRDVTGGYDNGPANLRELGLTVADCILIILSKVDKIPPGSTSTDETKTDVP
jgi:DNA-binding MltR family transcriptional regulator